jgi:YggT family protein
MDILGPPLFSLIDTLIRLYEFVIIVGAILSWLLAFNVINRNNQLVGMIGRTAFALTEPALRPIRRVIPPIGGMDITPVILLIGLEFLRQVLARVFIALMH